MGAAVTVAAAVARLVALEAVASEHRSQGTLRCGMYSTMACSRISTSSRRHHTGSHPRTTSHWAVA